MYFARKTWWRVSYKVMSNLHNCRVHGCELSVRSCRIFHGSPDIAWQCHGLGYTGSGILVKALGEFLPKGFRLLALLKATWRLPVVARPHLKTSSWCSGNRGCLFHVPNIVALHPPEKGSQYPSSQQWG